MYQGAVAVRRYGSTGDKIGIAGATSKTAGATNQGYSSGLTPPNQEAAAPPRVSAVVVSRNRAEQLRACLESLEKSQGRESLQIIVIDNGSQDGSQQLGAEFPNITHFLRLPKNFGLTRALNIGWRAAEAEYVLFLHEDTEVEPDAIARLARVLDERGDAAAVCPLLVDVEGNPAPQLGNLPPDGEYSPAEVSGSEPFAVTYPRGAALMVRAFVIKSIRKIDERYGQFGADADLAAHIRRGSKKILLVPGARARHSGGGDYDVVRRADLLLGRAAYIGKYMGFGAGLKAMVAAILGPLVSFRWGELKYTISGQKIDGTQE